MISTGQTFGPVEVSVENKWNASGKLVARAKIRTTWYLFGRRAEERGACRLVYTALSLQSDFKQGRYLSSSDHSFLRFLQHAFRAIIQR
jgi:hypothetical protein